jgi:hypothetical protein
MYRDNGNAIAEAVSFCKKSRREFMTVGFCSKLIQNLYLIGGKGRLRAIA